MNWFLTFYGDFIVSPNNEETKIQIEARGDNPRKPNIPIVIKSRRALTDRELKRLVRLSASDPSVSGDADENDSVPVLSNGNKVIFLDAVSGKDGPLKPTEVRFEVKGSFRQFYLTKLLTIRTSEQLIILTIFAKILSQENKSWCSKVPRKVSYFRYRQGLISLIP